MKYYKNCVLPSMKKLLFLPHLQYCSSSVPPHTTRPAPIRTFETAGPTPPTQSKQVEV